MTFEGVTKMKSFSKMNYNGMTVLIIPQTTGWFSIDTISLTGITRASINMGWQTPPVSGYTFELHLDSPGGQKIGEFTFAGENGKADAKAKPKFATLTTSIKPVTDGKMHDIYIVSNAKDPSITGTAGLVSLQFFLK